MPRLGVQIKPFRYNVYSFSIAFLSFELREDECGGEGNEDQEATWTVRLESILLNLSLFVPL